jgi:hypothetical protein
MLYQLTHFGVHDENGCTMEGSTTGNLMISAHVWSAVEMSQHGYETGHA